MTTNTVDPVVQYVEDTATLSHAIPFKFLANSDLVVTRTTDAGDTVLAEGTDFSVTGAGNDAGGTLTKTSAGTVGATITVRRQTSRAQGFDYTPGDTFPAESHEQALDRQSMVNQEQDADIERAFKVPHGEVAPELASMAELAEGDTLQFDGSKFVRTSAASSQLSQTVARMEELAAQAELSAAVSIATSVSSYSLGVATVSAGANFVLFRHRQLRLYTNGTAMGREDPQFTLGDEYFKPAPELQPGANWDGSEDSGFDTLPVDPPRVTAKPACRLIVPPRQRFTDTLLVGVMAFANKDDSVLDNDGMDQVRFHFEGRTHVVKQSSWQRFEDANGNEVTYYGWWVTLKKPDGLAGDANLYIEAVAADNTMQHRVIGPYRFSPQASQHDHEIEIAASKTEVAGSVYQTIPAALAWLKGQSPENPRLFISEAGKYQMNATSGGGSQGSMKGRVLIEATVAGVSIGRTEYTTDALAKILNDTFPLHFRGSNLTIDRRYVTEIEGSGAKGEGLHWLDGINMTTTAPEGRFEQLRGGRIDYFGWFAQWAWITECNISSMAQSCGQCSLARGNRLTDVAYDLFSGSLCAVWNVIPSHSDYWWLFDHKAFSVTYTGSEGTATFERSGGADANGVVFTASWGSNTATFEVGQDEDDYYNGGLGTIADGYGYSVQDLIDWINTVLNPLDSGWSATALVPDDTSIFANVHSHRAGRVSIAGEASKAFDPQNVKDTVLELFTGWDRHSDLYQHIQGEEENVIIMFNRGSGQFQTLFLGGNNGELRDAFMMANAGYIDPTPYPYLTPDFLSSQWGKANNISRHVLVMHNSLANQGMIIRRSSANMDIDDRSVLANNVFRDLEFHDDVEDLDLTIANNHTYGTEDLPSTATGNSEGGDVASLFADAANLDFTPQGELISNLAPAAVRYDEFGFDRGASAAKGVLA